MHIADLNECLAELPEISVLEYFRRRPAGGPFRWTGKDAVDGADDFVGPIFVDDRGIEYLVRTSGIMPDAEPRVCRVTRPNDTRRVQDMTRSSDVPTDLRKALVAFVADYAALKMAG
jgi:hypothetical protein